MSDELHPKPSPFSVVPESCIANIISLTSPHEACRAAGVSLEFKSAADSDTVWERFLPPNYKEIVSRASSLLAFSSKKELFFLLRRFTLLLDGGKLSFRLTKSGKMSYMLSARALQIASIDNPNHWGWRSLPESRFAEVAEVQSITKLEIRAIMAARMLSHNTNYVAWLMYMPSDGFSGLGYPSRASIKFVEGDGSETEGETNTVYIGDPSAGRIQSIIGIDDRRSWGLDDDWFGVELGEFFIGEGAAYDVHIQLSLTQPHNRKRGLIIDGIELQPRARGDSDSVFSTFKFEIVEREELM